jgi:hypothetical protein
VRKRIRLEKGEDRAGSRCVRRGLEWPPLAGCMRRLCAGTRAHSRVAQPGVDGRVNAAHDEPFGRGLHCGALGP